MTIFWICFAAYWVVSWVTLPDRYRRVLARMDKEWGILDNTGDARVFSFLLGSVWPLFYLFQLGMLAVSRMTQAPDHLTRKERAEVARQQEIEDTEARIKAARQLIRNAETSRMTAWDDQFRQLLGEHARTRYRPYDDPASYTADVIKDHQQQIYEKRTP